MAEFSRSLHRREINGKSFDDLNGKATKDKAVVLNKINHLEKLMNEYLGTGKEAGPVDGEKSILEFLRDTVSPGITQEDFSLYQEILEDLSLIILRNCLKRQTGRLYWRWSLILLKRIWISTYGL